MQLKWLAVWLAPELKIRQLSQFLLLRYDVQRATDLAELAARCGVLDAPEDALLTGKDLLDVAQGVQLGAMVKLAYKLQIDQEITDRVTLRRLVLKQ